jgi:hypothetical protein
MFRRHVIQVGNGGRGFVICTRDGERVITAAHCCLPLPRADRCGQLDGCIYKIGPLREKPSVGAELLFADVIADIAVLGQPENSGDAFDKLMASAVPLRIGRIANEWRTTTLKVRTLSLLDEWVSCDAIHSRGALWLRTVGDSKIVTGMSGSPIVADDESVVAVLAVVNGDPERAVHDGGGPQPCLAHCLPTWVSRAQSRA